MENFRIKSWEKTFWDLENFGKNLTENTQKIFRKKVGKTFFGTWKIFEKKVEEKLFWTQKILEKS